MSGNLRMDTLHGETKSEMAKANTFKKTSKTPLRSARMIIADVYDVDVAIHRQLNDDQRRRRHARAMETNDPYQWQARVGCMRYDFARRTPHYNLQALHDYVTLLAADVDNHVLEDAHWIKRGERLFDIAFELGRATRGHPAHPVATA